MTEEEINNILSPRVSIYQTPQVRVYSSSGTLCVFTPPQWLLEASEDAYQRYADYLVSKATQNDPNRKS